MFAHQDKNIAHAGDTVILYAGKSRINKVILEEGGTFCHRFGAFRHDDLIGKPYGTRTISKTKSGEEGTGFGYLLRPSYPDLWSIGPLDHHTQIIYPLDISQICFHLELHPGKRVIESGTGSGSLSLGFARCLYPNGRLDTFEFNQERMEATRSNFKHLGLEKIIFSHQRDVVENGFDVPDGCADAVFLDLPSPWNVVEDAYRCLNSEGNFCSFSPCIEQIQRTCDKLRETGFDDIRVIECLLRVYEVAPREYEELNVLQRRKKDKTLILPEVNDEMNDENSETKQEIESPTLNVLGKRTRESNNNNTTYTSKMKRFTDIKAPLQGIGSRPTSEMKGHTSFLLFARKVVK